MKKHIFGLFSTQFTASLGLCGLLLGSAFCCSAQTTGALFDATSADQELNDRTALLGIQLLIQEFVQLDSPFQSQLEDALVQRMRQTPKNYTQCAAGAEEATKWVRNQLKSLYAEKITTALSALDAPLPPETQKKFLNPPAAWLDRQTQQFQNATYPTVRQRLLDEQRQNWDKQVFPTESELDALPEATLKKLLSERFQQASGNHVIWEENAALLEENVLAPILQDAALQKKFQLEYAKRVNPPSRIWEAEALQRAMAQEMVKEAHTQFSGASKVYDLLPCASAELVRRSEHILELRLQNALKTISVPSLPDLIREKIVSTPNRDEALNLSRETFQSALLDAVQNQFSADQLPETRRQEVATLFASPENKIVIQQRVEQELEPVIRHERSQRAVAELTRRHSQLAQGSYQAEDATVEKFVNDGSFELPRPLQGQSNWGDTLTETQELAREKTRQALLAAAALFQQEQRAVATCYDAVRRAAQAQQDARQSQNLVQRMFQSAPLLELKTLQGFYTQAVLKACNGVRNTPFPQNIQGIELRSRAILQEILHPEAITTTPTPESAPTPAKIALEAEFILSRGTSETNAKLQYGSLALEFSTPAQLENALQTHTSELPTPAPEQTCSITIVVSDGFLPYHYVETARTLLQQRYPGTISDHLSH